MVQKNISSSLLMFSSVLKKLSVISTISLLQGRESDLSDWDLWEEQTGCVWLIFIFLPLGNELLSGSSVPLGSSRGRLASFKTAACVRMGKFT